MKIKRDSVVMLLAALLALCATVVVHGLARAGSPTHVRASSDVSLIPQRPELTLAPLPVSQNMTSVQKALSVAMSEFRLREGEIDQSAGAVSAVLSRKADRVHQHERVWVITADRDEKSPWGITFHKLVIVINSSTGQYDFAYMAAPDPTQLRALRVRRHSVH